MAAADSPEQMLFASTTQSFLERSMPVARVRELHDADSSFDAGWWRQAAELGWAALLVPEELGGGSVSEDGVENVARLSRQLGATVAAGPLHPVSIVLAGLVEDVRACGEANHSSLIESLIEGSSVASWAVYEPDRGWDPLFANVTATATESGYRIDGVKDRVEAGGECDVLLVVASTPDGLRQFVVPTESPGVKVEQESSIDLVKRFARVSFEGVHLPATALVGTDVRQTIERQSQIALVMQCAEVVGICDAVMEFTAQWMNDRMSFGRPLASYQSLKHSFADMRMWQEACRATTASAVTAVASRSPDAAEATSIAKSYVGEHAGKILQQSVQLHGGIGVTWEHDLHVYLRRAALYRALYGTPEEHNLRIYAIEEAKSKKCETAK